MEHIKNLRCPCMDREDIRCDDEHCDIAGPGAPNNPDVCRICWLRLGKPGEHTPGHLRRAWNYAHAVRKHIRAGLPVVDEPTARARLGQCESCRVYFDAKQRICKHPECGCPMDTKVTWAEQMCPIGRWNAVAADGK